MTSSDVRINWGGRMPQSVEAHGGDGTHRTNLGWVVGNEWRPAAPRRRGAFVYKRRQV